MPPVLVMLTGLNGEQIVLGIWIESPVIVLVPGFDESISITIGLMFVEFEIAKQFIKHEFPLEELLELEDEPELLLELDDELEATVWQEPAPGLQPPPTIQPASPGAIPAQQTAPFEQTYVWPDGQIGMLFWQKIIGVPELEEELEDELLLEEEPELLLELEEDVWQTGV